MTKRNPFALVSLICGILAIPTVGFLGIPAVIFGHIGISRAKRDPCASGRVPAIVGTTLGYCGVALLILGFAFVFIGAFVHLLAGNKDIARAGRVDADFQAITTQLRTYEMMNMRMPTTAQGLAALVERPNEAPPRRWIQLLERVPLDPWGEFYEYRNPGTFNQNGFDLVSKGPDRILGTSDDILSR